MALTVMLVGVTFDFVFGDWLLLLLFLIPSVLFLILFEESGSDGVFGDVEAVLLMSVVRPSNTVGIGMPDADADLDENAEGGVDIGVVIPGDSAFWEL